jgi:predicted nucleic-acid-binding Zn-ribbon protein
MVKQTKKINRSQKGKGLFSTDVKEYGNLKYKDNSFTLPQLVCTVKGCNGKDFKHRSLKLGTKMKSYLLDTDVFDNAYSAFTCVNCGFVQFYSDNTKFGSKKSSSK